MSVKITTTKHLAAYYVILRVVLKRPLASMTIIVLVRVRTIVRNT